MVFVLVLLSLVLAGFAVWALIWAINKNQFDDLDSPAFSILDDDMEQNQPKKSSQNASPEVSPKVSPKVSNSAAQKD